MFFTTFVEKLKFNFSRSGRIFFRPISRTAVFIKSRDSSGGFSAAVTIGGGERFDLSGGAGEVVIFRMWIQIHNTYEDGRNIVFIRQMMTLAENYLDEGRMDRNRLGTTA